MLSDVTSSFRHGAAEAVLKGFDGSVMARFLKCLFWMLRFMLVTLQSNLSLHINTTGRRWRKGGGEGARAVGEESNCILRFRFFFFFDCTSREDRKHSHAHRRTRDAHIHTYIHRTDMWVGGQDGGWAGALLRQWAVVKGSLPSTPSLSPSLPPPSLLVAAAVTTVIAADWSRGGRGRQGWAPRRGEAGRG